MIGAWALMLGLVVGCGDDSGATDPTDTIGTTSGGTTTDATTDATTTDATTTDATTTDATTTDATTTDATTTEATTTETESTTEDPGGICGDGVIDRGEECDDGEGNGDDQACTSTCKLAFCGDGLVQAGVEECDDANDDDLDGCSNDCKLAVCGDGVLQEGEQCDDGNDDDHDTCTNMCTDASCGDGIVWEEMEECDDGEGNGDDQACTSTCENAFCGDGLIYEEVEECDDGEDNSDSAACTSMCAAAVCGDGLVHEGVEECDDGNLVDGDGCSAECAIESCMSFINTNAEDVNNNTWFDACVNAPGNTVTVRLLDDNNAVVYEATGTKVGVWNENQLTSTAAANGQYHSSNHNRLVVLDNGDRLMITGKNASNSGCGGSYGNGYGIVIYPTNPNYYHNPKMIVMPYRHQFGNNNARAFTSWTTSHEISWNNGLPMNTCSGPVVSFFGTFQLQVTQ